MQTKITSVLLRLVCLCATSSCLTIMSADSEGFRYTSLGGDVSKIAADVAEAALSAP